MKTNESYEQSKRDFGNGLYRVLLSATERYLSESGQSWLGLHQFTQTLIKSRLRAFVAVVMELLFP